MKHVFLLCFILIGGLLSNAQTVTEVATDSIMPETFTIEKDSRIDILLDKKILITKTTTIQKLASTEKVKVDKHGRVNMPGFRVQVMNSTDRALVYQTKGKLYQLYPNHKQYVIAQAPFFKLRLGNFATKAEADKYRKALSPMFPSGVYVVPDIIEGKVKVEKEPTEKEE